MIRRRALFAAPLLLATPALRAQSLIMRQDDFLAPGIRRGALIRWGDRVAFDAPAWTPAQPTVEAAAAQFGWDARIIALLPAVTAEDRVPRAVLAVAHPGVDAAMAFPDGRDRPDVAGEMQGVSLLNLARRGAEWIVVDGGFQNRRLTARTLCRLGAEGGPAVGIIGVTGGCATPWGSVLLAEGGAAAWAGRLPGINPRAMGMLTELDPADPASVPVKHAAPGRFGAVDAAAGLAADGRAVVWMVDGRPGGFLYRFVSDETAGPRALDAGRLAAARFEGGSLRWLPLQEGDPFAAARNAGATPLDQARAVAFDAQQKRLCLATRGGPGQVLDIRAAAGDLAAETGIAEVILNGREAPLQPTRRGEAVAAVPAWPWAPASLGFDGDGAVLLGTDRGDRPGALPEAFYRVPVVGADRGQPSLLLATPVGAAASGVAVAADGTIIAAVAHPGAAPGATWATPATRWPGLRADEPPRSTVVTLAR
ncbi:alkaline phosphatase PhoX [Neoroseomonas lacus]|uniref:dTDP-glucose 4,6-dehydratase n=1 Tax=Neoroseomonas lacus TaxID=287609 RepID=A0A917KVT5_9PROT|nr:alkaline phosphatase PhoX [Neoroseomonas lacus]GGJ29696.1 dTDP-glucose 4,6-dehydratase [Neoroseomonas lacus]